MKLCIVGDIHFSSTSSILRERGKVFTKRLENCIESINYVEKVAADSKCDYIIYLGDFFDKETLNSEELTALQSIEWSNVKKIFLVGNHEMGAADLSKSSAHIFNLIPNSTVVDTPNGIVGFGCRLLFLPYILKNDRKTISEYYNEVFASTGLETQEVKDTYIFSHNDIKGLQLGNFVSKEGFDIKDIANNCLSCFNGHLHNGEQIDKKLINVGNLTGQNFSEDAKKYAHRFFIYDTLTRNLQLVLNPYAYYFQKWNISSMEDFVELKNFCEEPTKLILSVKCINSLSPTVRSYLERCENVVTFRIVNVMEDSVEVEDTISELTSTDYVGQFADFVFSLLGNNSVVAEELQKVAK